MINSCRLAADHREPFTSTAERRRIRPDIAACKMIARYKRAARTFAELALGEFAPPHEAIAALSIGHALAIDIAPPRSAAAMPPTEHEKALFGFPKSAVILSGCGGAIYLWRMWSRSMGYVREITRLWSSAETGDDASTGPHCQELPCLRRCVPLPVRKGYLPARPSPVANEP